MPFTEAASRLIASYPSYSVEAFSPEFIRHQARLLDAIEAEARAEGYAAGLLEGSSSPAGHADLAAAREAVSGLDLPLGNDLHVSRARSEVIRDFAAAIDALSDPSGHVGPADLHDPRSEEQG